MGTAAWRKTMLRRSIGIRKPLTREMQTRRINSPVSEPSTWQVVNKREGSILFAANMNGFLRRGHSSASPLRSASPAWRNLDIESLVDALLVQTTNQLRHGRFEYLADAEQGGDGDRPTGLNLLPVASNKARLGVSPKQTAARRYHFNTKRMKKVRLTPYTGRRVLICSPKLRAG
jgi:hypothetical protein